MKDNKTVIVGIDIGSVSADTVVMDENYSVLESHYTRTQGAPLEITKDILDDVISRYGKDSIKLVSVTGSGGKLIAPLIGATFTNEVISQARAVEQLYPEAKTVIEMGGQDAKLILMAHEDDGSTRIEDFQMNSVCAAGTGSFLDQQGTRMGLTIEEFGELSLKSKNPPRIAGRCSVFAKSDMIHLQQAATPDYDIVAGLCYAVARNFKSTIGKGKDFKAPVIFQGGVAANQGVRKAFQEVLELKDDEFIVPEMYAFTGAIGAAIYADERKKGVGKFKGTDELKKFIGSGRKQEKSLEALHRPEGHPSQRKSSTGYSLDKDNKVDVYMGLDIGSTSTNVVLIDKDQNIVSKRYLPTAGRPLEAVRQGLQEVGDECSDAVNVLGVGATGSGRYLIGDFVGGDVIRNEITAQAKAA
ncbi:MAG: CoA activase, partial [Deltaproteobacteria bacterium]|nr:CoA activase [Deltaproteobacteria bacterium]